MLKKTDFLKKYPHAYEGMDAYTIEGEKLGRVAFMQDDYITIEKGVFFPKDFTFRYDDIVETRDNSVVINQNRENLENWKNEKYKGWEEYERLSKSGEASIPVREEELNVQKVTRPAGEVHVRKVVHTEMKQFTVPVSKEEVIIERKAVPEGKTTEKGERAFKEEEITIPVSEEKVEVTKRPVTKEEIHISKKTKTEQEVVSGKVRKEEIKIDKDEEERGRKAA